MPTPKELIALAAQHHQAGDTTRAEQLYRQLLQQNPHHADALHLLGVIALQAGRHDEAIELITKALQFHRANPSYFSNLAGAYLGSGKPEEARKHLEEALRLQPSFAQGHNNLGMILRREGKLEEAIGHFREAIRFKPDFGDAYINLGKTLKAQDKRQLRRRTGQGLASQGAVPEATLALANQHLQRGLEFKRGGKLQQAAEQFQKAVRLVPNSAGAHAALGTVLNEVDKRREALVHLQKAVKLNPADVGSRINLGVCLKEGGKPEEAIPHLEEALRLHPNSMEAQNNLGSLYVDVGRIPEAVERFQKAMALKPSYSMPYYCLSELAVQGKYTFTDAEVERLRGLLGNQTLPKDERSVLNFALAALLEKEGKYDEAFAHYRTGNDLRREALQHKGQQFKPERFRAGNDLTLAIFDRVYFEKVRSWGTDSRLPVFIVGLPRSGTTLVEQILASHPQVHGAGELREMKYIADDLPKELQGAEPYPSCMASLDATTARRIADKHIAFLQGLEGAATRVVDKLPLNCLRLGLIATLFPRATIIHTRRDPIDTCLSCYFQNFRGLYYTNTLADLGFYYREYERVMAHWREVVPLQVLEVNYEELVGDQEEWSRKLVAHCGLEWDERCLKFYENARAVQTASKLQVRQPIYKKSVARWKRYEAHLQPLIEALGAGQPASNAFTSGPGL